MVVVWKTIYIIKMVILEPHHILPLCDIAENFNLKVIHYRCEVYTVVDIQNDEVFILFYFID